MVRAWETGLVASGETGLSAASSIASTAAWMASLSVRGGPVNLPGRPGSRAVPAAIKWVPVSIVDMVFICFLSLSSFVDKGCYAWTGEIFQKIRAIFFGENFERKVHRRRINHGAHGAAGKMDCLLCRRR